MFFASYLLTAVITYTCFIYWKHEIGVAFLCGILYAFLPWHYFYNAQMERYCYFLIPIIVVGLTNIAKGSSEMWSNRSWIGYALILLAIGKFEKDLAVVTMICLLAAVWYGIDKGKVRRDWYKLAVLCAGLFFCIVAHYLRKYFAGTLEYYSLADISASALEIFYFFVPIPKHRFAMLNEIFGEEVYRSLPGDVPATSMGILLSISFVALLLQMIFKQYKNKQNHFICVLNLILIMISHAYCLNIFLGQVFPYFNGYDMAYLFIALFACMKLADILDKFSRIVNNKIWVWTMTVILTSFCLWDMSSAEWKDYREWSSDTQEYCVNMQINVEDKILEIAAIEDDRVIVFEDSGDSMGLRG